MADWKPEPGFAAGLVEWLEDVRDEAAELSKEFGPDPDDESFCIDVRLRVHEGSAEFLSGDAQYDTDHRGFWGSSSVCEDTSDEALFELAEELIQEVLGAQEEARS